MIEWRSDSTAHELRLRIGRVDPAGRDVPLALWTPAPADGPAPLVLIGHGSGGHKSDESRRDLAQRYGAHGIAVAAIDGPWQGERSESLRAEYDDELIDAMIADWRATLDAVAALDEIDADRTGYGGVSMGTLFGLPLVAAEPRIRAAVLGLCGLRGSGGERVSVADRLQRDAATIDIPLLYLAQWDDEIFDRGGVFELFDTLGTPDRTLIASPGQHHETPPRVRQQSVDFLVTQLAGSDAGGG